MKYEFGGNDDNPDQRFKAIRESTFNSYTRDHITLSLNFKSNYSGKFSLKIRANVFDGEFEIENLDSPTFHFVVDGEGIIFEAEYDKLQEVVDKMAKTY